MRRPLLVAGILAALAALAGAVRDTVDFTAAPRRATRTASAAGPRG